MSLFSLVLLLIVSIVGIQSSPILPRGSLCQTLVLNYKTCADLAYVDDNSVNVKISLGGSLLHDQNVNVNNPQPICGSKFGAEVCYLFVVVRQDNGFNVCVQVKGTYPIFGTTITNLGCSVVSNQ